MHTTYDIFIAVGPYNKLGGIERYNVELVKALTDAGHHVSIIATEVGYSTDNLDHVVMIQTNLFPPALNFLVNALKVSWRYHQFKKKHPDGLFISNGLPSFFSDFLIAQSVHRQAVIETNAREPKTVKGYVRRFLRTVRPLNVAIISVERFAVKRGAKRVIAIAQKVKREIVTLYGVSEKRVIVVHSAVNAKEFAPNAQTKDRVRRAFNFADDDFLFLFSGNEFKRKGLGYAIAALAEIRDPKVKLVIAGRAKDATFKEIAKRQHVEDRTFFIGPRSDFADWCATCDAFLFPTLDEAFGLVIAEALATGLPVITSGPVYAGAAERMRSDFDSLLLNDPSDVKEIEADMRRLIASEDLRATLGKNGRKTAEALSWEHTAEGIVNAWNAYRESPKA